MQQLMLFLAAVFATVAAVDMQESVTPVQKVVQMLTGMIEKGKKEKHEEQVQFASYKQFCDDNSVKMSKQISEAGDQISMLRADIQKQRTEAADLAREVQDLQGDVATYGGDQKGATRVRELQRKEYDATHKDYSESIEAIGKAVAVLKKQAFDRKQKAGALLQDVISFEKVPESSKRMIEAFLAKNSEEQELDLAAAPSAYGYEFQSHGVVDMLEKLKDKFVDERSALQKAEMTQRHAHDMLQQDLKESISLAEAAISTKSQAKSKASQIAASREGDLADTESSKKDDTEYLAGLTSSCTQKLKDFESRQKLRSEELVAVEKAVEILSSDDISGASKKHLSMLQADNYGFPSLVQMKSTNVNAVSNQMRMAAYLNDQAGRIGSQVLSMIAVHATEDPFSKVKKMIRDLITRLEEQAGEETQHKGWCDTELAENDKARKTRSDSVDSLKSEIDELSASISKAAAEITQITSQVADLDGNVAKETEIRQKDKAENEATIKDSKDAQTAVSRAVLVLKEFYASAGDATALFQKSQQHQGAPPVFGDTPYQGMSGESGGVVGMLEVIQSDFARLESDTTAAEVSQAQQHNKFMSESGVTKAQKNSDLTHKASQKQREEQSLVDKQNDLLSEEKELDAANKYFDKLKPSCLDAGMSFQEREARRQEEIQSLQEAMRILNGEDIALLMQES